MTRGPLSLRIEVAPADGEDAEALDDLTRALREELLELDVDAVSRPSEPAPDGARAVDAAILASPPRLPPSRRRCAVSSRCRRRRSPSPRSPG